MASNAEDSNSAFPDLLSAALGESGLADDFADFFDILGSNANKTQAAPAPAVVQTQRVVQAQPVVQTKPVVQVRQVTQPYLQARLANQGQTIVQTRPGVQQHAVLQTRPLTQTVVQATPGTPGAQTVVQARPGAQTQFVVQTRGVKQTGNTLVQTRPVTQVGKTLVQNRPGTQTRVVQTKSGMQIHNVVQTRPGTQGQTVFQTRPVQLGNTLVQARQVKQAQNVVQTRPVTVGNTIVQTRPVTQAQTVVQTRPVTSGNTLVQTRPAMQAQTVVQTRPVVQNQTLVQTRPVAQNQTLVQTRPVVQNQTLVQTRPVAQNQTLVQTRPVAQNQTLVQTRPVAQNQTLVQTRPVVQNQTLVQTRPVAQNQTLVQTRPVTQPQTVVQARPALQGTNLVQTKSAPKTPNLVQTPVTLGNTLGQARPAANTPTLVQAKQVAQIKAPIVVHPPSLAAQQPTPAVPVSSTIPQVQTPRSIESPVVSLAKPTAPVPNHVLAPNPVLAPAPTERVPEPKAEEKVVNSVSVEPAAAAAAAPVEMETEGGGSEEEDLSQVDLFSQALLQLAATNSSVPKLSESLPPVSRTPVTKPEAPAPVIKKTIVAPVGLPSMGNPGSPSVVHKPQVSAVSSSGLTGTQTPPQIIRIQQQPQTITKTLNQRPGSPSVATPSTSYSILRSNSPVTTIVRTISPSGKILQTLANPVKTSANAAGMYTTTSPLVVNNPTLVRTASVPQRLSQGNISLLRNGDGQTTRVNIVRTTQVAGNHTTTGVGSTAGNSRIVLSHPLLSGGTNHKIIQGAIHKSASFPSNLGGNIRIVTLPSTSAMQTNKSIFSTISSPGSPLMANGLIKTELTNKDVSRLWSNEDIKLKNMTSGTSRVKPEPGEVIMGGLEEEAEEEDEELGRAETYADYMPSKLKLGIKHPDSVVETSSLSSVEPQNVWYNPSIPESTIDYGHLSALQLESIVYAAQRHETFLPSGERAGFLIGDGAGVGKGRTIAGVIFENYLQGRKRALWLSVSNDLRFDAERDLRDIGATKIDVHPLNKFKYAKISSKENGSVKKGVIFATYSSLIGESQSSGKYRTRLKQLLRWLGEDFDGCIIFDECHKAKNLCPVGSSKPTKTGMYVLEIQNKLPKARIVYASATGASEPKNMAYMTRLGLWGKGTPFNEFSDFIQAVEKRGVGAMELVAMDMKLRGMYIARQLSFHGVTFKIEEIPPDKEFIHMYNEAVRLWVEARAKFQKAAELIDAEQRMRKSMWGQFWSAHQRFFKYLCISAKVKHCVRIAREAVKNGKCVVIGLQSTGEARTLEQLEEAGGELNDFVSTAKGVFQSLIEKHFPAPDRRKTMDWLGLGSSLFGDSPSSSPKSSTGKRKNNFNSKKSAKKLKSGGFSDDSSDSDSDSAASSAGVISDISLSESESSEPPDSDDNPFGCFADSDDDDPWLKKSKKKKKKTPKPKKVKKEKKKKKAKKKKKKQDGSDDEDEMFDQALSAAGLIGNKNNSFKENLNSSYNGKTSAVPGMDAVDQAIAFKRELLEKIERFGDKLPPNTIDELIDSLGGTENVAEMTGRKGRVVSTEDGQVQYESRSEIDAPLEVMNLTEKQRFMDGEKYIALISEAASSGISLQSDRRAVNQRRRVHITLELPWSADRAVQQFGRSHRSNQVNAPEYIFLISALAGERRFASTVAKRLESLGALTHGDRRATETRDLSRFNIDNKYGRTALEGVMKSVLALDSALVPPPAEYSGNFFQDFKMGLVGVGMVTIDERYNLPQLEKDYNNLSKFLNRILGMEVELQNAAFKYFMDVLAAIILEAKRNGRWDLGILDLGSGAESVKLVETKTFVGKSALGTAKTELHTVSVERGMTWQVAMDKWHDHNGSDDGFYTSRQARNAKPTAMLATAMTGKKRNKLFSIYRPNTGLQSKAETIEEIKKKYKRVTPDEAQGYWMDQFSASETTCTHAYWRGNCKRVSVGLPCEIGLRSRTYHVLAGSVLSVWSKVESVLASMPGGHNSKMQIIRLRTEADKRIVGSLIPANCVNPLSNVLSQDAQQTFNKKHPPLSSSRSFDMPFF